MASSRWKVFLINGLAQNAGHWNPRLIDELDRQSWVEGVVTPDLPGAGKLTHHDSPTRIAEYVPIMRQSYKHELTIDAPKLLIGLSLGGMVASDWCHQYPDDFQKVILINTSFGKLAAAHRRLQPRAWLTFASVFFGRSHPAREQRTLDLVSNDPDQRAAMLPHWIEARRKHPTARSNALRQLYAARNYTAPPSLPKHAVVVCSRHDRLCHYTAGERIAQHYQVPLIVDSTPTIGHAFHVDGAEKLVAIIEDFIDDRLACVPGELRMANRA